MALVWGMDTSPIYTAQYGHLTKEIRLMAGPCNSTITTKIRAKGITRLRDALQRKGGDSLTVPLLILIAQCRQGIIFKTDSKHLKLISQLYDGCQETFFHYCDFLTSAYDDAKYAAGPG